MMMKMFKDTGGHITRAFAITLCFLFVIMGCSGIFAAKFSQDAVLGSLVEPVYAAENNNEDAEDYDLYKVASDASAAFQNALGGAMTDDGEATGKGSKDARKMLFGEGGGDDNVPKTGNVCSYLGYVDSKKSDWIIKIKNVFSTENTAASSKYSYSQFKNMKDIVGIDSDAVSDGLGFQSYANYGRLLADLGFDTVGQSKGIMRIISGYALIFAYLLASSVPLLFAYVVKFLNMINPFVLLGEGAYKLADSSSSLSELGKWVSNLWDALQSLSLVAIIPLFFAFAFGTALLMYQPGGSSKIGDSVLKFVIRILFIILAIPMTGAIYTSFLSQISNLSGYGSDAADAIIYSEVVDFQGWASRTRLAAPEGVTLSWDTKNGCAKLPGGSIRSVVIKINDMAGHNVGDRATYDGSNEKFRKYVNVGNFKVLDLSKTEYTEGSDKWKTAQSTSKGMELLKRYALGDVYSSSAFASEVNGDRLKIMNGGNDDAKEEISKMFLEGDVGGEIEYSMAKSDVGGARNIFGNGLLKTSGGEICKYSCDTSGEVLSKFNNLSYGGLSTVGMYNYLNSSFSNSEVTVFSSKYSTSEYVKDAHFSVSILGSGVWKVLWYAQSFVTLMCMALIGLIYALSMALTGIRQGGRMLAALPGAALGSMQFIGRFIAAFVVMIADVLISVVLYSFFCEFLNVAVEATSNIIPSTTSLIGQTAGGSNMPLMIGNVQIPLMVEFSLINFIGVVFSILLIGYITVLAIRNRVVFIHSVDEVVSGSIGRMLGAKNGIGRGHKKGSLLGAAAGTAAGVAAGHMIAKKFESNGDDGKDGKPGEGGAKGGPKFPGGGPDGDGGAGPQSGGGSGGEQSWYDDEGNLHERRADGGERITRPDGTVVDYTGAGGWGDRVTTNPDGSTVTETLVDDDYGYEVTGSTPPTLEGVNDLDNVDAETGAMTTANGGTGKTVQANATQTGQGKGAAAGQVRQVGAPAGSGTVDASGASTQSLGAMPERGPKTAKFYEGADKAAASITDNSPEAQAKPGYVKGMSSGAFTNGEFSGNAAALSKQAKQGAVAANFVQQYNNATDEAWKAANAQKYQKARAQVIRSQHIMKQAGVNGANSSKIMSQSQWNSINRTISNDYSKHVGGQKGNQRGNGQRGAQTRPQNRTTATRARSAQPGNSSGGASGRGGNGRATI